MSTKIIKAWVNGSAQDIEVEEIVSPEQELSIYERVEILEKGVTTYTTVTLFASDWVGNSAPYSQVVAINGVTPNTQVNLTPTSAQIAELQNDDIAFVAENENGIVTVYSINCKPEIDYTIQAVLTEVNSL